MPFTVMLSPDAEEYLDSLDDKRARDIRKHLRSWRKIPSSRELPVILILSPAAVGRPCTDLGWENSERSFSSKSRRCLLWISSQRRGIRPIGKINNQARI
jgi:hypothetical protein